jgi:hypothetical protein
MSILEGGLDEETQNTISWTVAGINTFVMLCSGLVIDFHHIRRYLFRDKFRWDVITGT